MLPAAKVSVPAAPSAMETTEVASVPVTLPFAAVDAIMAIAKKDMVPRVHKVKAPEVTLRGFL